jgi:hypothetical protein
MYVCVRTSRKYLDADELLLNTSRCVESDYFFAAESVSDVCMTFSSVISTKSYLSSIVPYKFMLRRIRQRDDAFSTA